MKHQNNSETFGNLRYSGWGWLLALSLAWLVGGCSLAPDYRRPETATPAAFKELAPQSAEGTNIWKVAAPKDDQLRGKWWELFNNAELNGLEEQLVISNQNLVAAMANVTSARAMVKQARSQYYPTLAASPAVSRGRSMGGGSYPTRSDYSLPLSASWEADLWGKVRNSVNASAFEAQATLADLEATRLAAQATLAINYFELQSQDALVGLYDETVRAYQDSLGLTRVRFETGISSDEDVAQAETQLAGAQAQAANIRLLREQYEHAIAVLVGQPPSSFSLPPRPLDAALPQVPVGLPSRLLERRPDVAAAERRVAEANARIGIARAAYYPAITFSAKGGFESLSPDSLLRWSSRIWSVGAGMSETLFDAGMRKAVVLQYRAEYTNSVAKYRQTVLTAFQQVEDALSAVRVLGEESGHQESAVKSSGRYLDLASERYKLGIDSYLNVVSAQATHLGNRQTLMNLRVQQLSACIQLIEALGGGWDEKL
jgi:NodT family efflux transporter outer membrane factor (OMF) lipoprotein